jgi:hypothetical protein
MKHLGWIGLEVLMKHPGRIDGVTAGAGIALAESMDEGSGVKNWKYGRKIKQ